MIWNDVKDGGCWLFGQLGCLPWLSAATTNIPSPLPWERVRVRVSGWPWGADGWVSWSNGLACMCCFVCSSAVTCK